MRRSGPVQSLIVRRRGANAIFLGLLGRLGWVCAKICGADQALSARPFTFGLFCFCLGLGRWSVGDVSHPGCSSFVGKYCCALSLVVRKGSSVLIFSFLRAMGVSIELRRGGAGIYDNDD